MSKQESKNATTAKKKKPIMQYVIGIVSFISVVIASSILMYKYMSELAVEDRTFGEAFFFVIIILIVLYFSIFLQTVIHETGHLIFGLISGYRFSYFRIKSRIWVKEGGKLKTRRTELPEKGGQCLMSPPDFSDGKMPYVLYNLGGILCNGVAGVIFLILYFLWQDVPTVPAILLMLAVTGFAYALINGIPMHLDTSDNDGRNALSLGKSKEALRAFWVQMKANEQMTKGVRLKDMPEEWFAVPDEEGMKNSMTAVLGVFACKRLMDEKRLEEADRLMEQLLEADTAIVDLHRSLMICDRIYCELVGECREEKLEKLFTKDVEKFMKSMKKSPSVVRTKYAIALICVEDVFAARDELMQLATIAETYPYSSDITSQRELMKLARERFNEKLAAQSEE